MAEVLDSREDHDQLGLDRRGCSAMHRRTDSRARLDLMAIALRSWHLDDARAAQNISSLLDCRSDLGSGSDRGRPFSHTDQTPQGAAIAQSKEEGTDEEPRAWRGKAVGSHSVAMAMKNASDEDGPSKVWSARPRRR